MVIPVTSASKKYRILTLSGPPILSSDFSSLIIKYLIEPCPDVVELLKNNILTLNLQRRMWPLTIRVTLPLGIKLIDQLIHLFIHQSLPFLSAIKIGKPTELLCNYVYSHFTFHFVSWYIYSSELCFVDFHISIIQFGRLNTHSPFLIFFII